MHSYIVKLSQSRKKKIPMKSKEWCHQTGEAAGVRGAVGFSNIDDCPK